MSGMIEKRRAVFSLSLSKVGLRLIAEFRDLRLGREVVFLCVIMDVLILDDLFISPM